MELNIYGLKCDNPTCDYNDESIRLEEYEKYINHPCPKCSAPLLTQADYDTTMQIVQFAKMAQNLTAQQGHTPLEEPIKINIELNGTGIPNFNVSKLGENDA